MKRTVPALAGAAAALLLMGIWWARPRDAGTPSHVHSSASRVETAPLCPWREPARDLRAYFHGATGTREETLILSHLRVALIDELGRPLTAEEMVLRPQRVLRGEKVIGTVLVRRVKGEYGAIELVLAVDPAGSVRGLRVQRHREPEPVAAALIAPGWLASFQGKTADSQLQPGEDLPRVSSETRTSLTAVADGVRSLLILLRAAEQRGRPGRSA
jgi:hypothetical protein